MSGLPFTAKGSTGEVTFTGSAILIRRKGILGALRQFSGLGKGNKDIPLSAVTGVRIEPASLMNKAFFQIIHSGDVAVRGGASEVMKDDNAVFFSNRSTADFEQLGKMILDSLAVSRTSAQATSSATTDIAGLLQKLSDLKAQGILTDEEFSLKKADLLSRM